MVFKDFFFYIREQFFQRIWAWIWPKVLKVIDVEEGENCVVKSGGGRAAFFRAVDVEVS